MKVLHVHSGNLYGGVETTLLAQARHRNPGLDMEMSFALCFAGRFSEELAETRAPVYWLNEVRVRNPFSVTRARQRLRALLRQHRFDVVVAHSSWSQAIFGRVAKSAKLPLVFWLHDAITGRHWLERWASRVTPDLAICNSYFTANLLPLLYKRVTSEVLYYPVTLADNQNGIEERKEIRAELKTSEDSIVIIQVGRMESCKGHHLHMAALALLKDLPRWVCWQVGGSQRSREGKYLKKLKESAVSLGIDDRLRFLDHRGDVGRLLAAADIYCQPNVGPETFGITFVEAMWAGLPVITTALGGAQEVISDSCALRVQPGEVNSLAASLRRLVQDRGFRRELGSAGHLRARELCDVSRQVASLRNHLVTVTAGHQSVN